MEGTFEEMWTSLSVTICGLPPETMCFVGHEYTVKNYTFGVEQDPGNELMRARLDWAQKVTAEGGVTVPTTVEEEWRTNIFLRGKDAAFCSRHKVADAFRAFQKMRTLKNGSMIITLDMLKGTRGMIPGKFRRMCC
mmetsp:Transcript_110214/g.174199  ORF Transcript_110214/g.174199 Transcript_110214/m.174199 type:complete len:136 (+) Transcript_110214:3-410(+)